MLYYLSRDGISHPPFPKRTLLRRNSSRKKNKNSIKLNLAKSSEDLFEEWEKAEKIIYPYCKVLVKRADHDFTKC